MLLEAGYWIIPKIVWLLPGAVTKYACMLNLYPSGFYGFAGVHVVIDSRGYGDGVLAC